MYKVWKYNTKLPGDRRLNPPHFTITLPRCGDFSIALPIGAKVLALKEHNGDITLFVLVDTLERQTEVRRFFYYGTGQEIDSSLPLVFLSSLNAFGGQADYHFFELTSGRQ